MGKVSMSLSSASSSDGQSQNVFGKTMFGSNRLGAVSGMSQAGPGWQVYAVGGAVVLLALLIVWRNRKK